MKEYLTPREAAAALGISASTVSRMKKAGAPIHHWGPPGTRMYRIVLSELIEWMEAQGEQTAEARTQTLSMEELRAARHRLVNSRK